MLFDVSYIICCSSVGLHGTIAWRLLRQGREMSFINQLLALHFIFNTVASSVYLHFFFKLGSVSLVKQDHLDQEDTAALCVHYIKSFIGLYIMGSLPSFGIVFCRFIYARYAHGLVADRGRLFHKIILLVIIIFTIHHLLIWYFDSQNDYKDRIKGRICNQIEFLDIKNKEFHVKPKLLVSIGVCLYMVALIFFQRSANRQRRFHNIPKRRQNLITINQHIFCKYLIGTCLLFDQLIFNTFIQLFHTSLGPHSVLQIWWVWHLIMFILIHVLSPLCVYYCATQQYLEFKGLKARRYPGQENPRRQVVMPRRDNFIAKEKSEESGTKARARKKGGSKSKTVFITVMPIISEEHSGSPSVNVD